MKIDEKYIDWYPITEMPKDGTIVFIKDTEGNVDLAKWSFGEITSEFGLCNDIKYFSELSISRLKI